MPFNEIFDENGNVIFSEEVPDPELPLMDKLNAIIETQPITTQVQFGPLIAAGNLYIQQGKIEHLRTLVETASIPPELIPIREAMLAVIP
jgi:hypothetical protein